MKLLEKPVNDIKLRVATASDIPNLKYWDTKKHVIVSGGVNDKIDWEKEVARKETWQKILIAEVDNRPIGVVMIIDPRLEETHYWGNIEPDLRAIDIWIGEEEDLGKGYGSEMMRQALEKCYADGAKAVLVDPLTSNTRAHNFYEKMGFRRVEKRMFGEDECYVCKIDRKEWLLKNE